MLTLIYFQFIIIVLYIVNWARGCGYNNLCLIVAFVVMSGGRVTGDGVGWCKKLLQLIRNRALISVS